ncbi:hypothetical protein PCASD_09578 [Puccinia coronata f. sp. avenae]|uniref:Uncharacterized protein n=1 Tax=Puccinia coronata f. sp. avenae TaxID=200324 RepID=A0A2N5V2D0_9BASI|nr:hypothetical protein PCASD_09578 [Puccinia coronata f. sp. avenae]
MIINQDPLLTRISYRSGPGKIYQMIHSMDLLIQDLLPAIFKLSDFVPKGLLRIFKDPWVPPFEDSPALSLPLKIITQHCPLAYSLVSNLAEDISPAPILQPLPLPSTTSPTKPALCYYYPFIQQLPTTTLDSCTAGINRSNTAVRAVLEQPCSTGGRTGTVRPKHLPAGRTGLSDQFLGPVAQDQPGPVGQICPTSWLSLRSDSVRPTTGQTRLFEHRSSSRVRPVNAGSVVACILPNYSSFILVIKEPPTVTLTPKETGQLVTYWIERLSGEKEEYIASLKPSPYNLVPYEAKILIALRRIEEQQDLDLKYQIAFNNLVRSHAATRRQRYLERTNSGINNNTTTVPAVNPTCLVPNYANKDNAQPTNSHIEDKTIEANKDFLDYDLNNPNSQDSSPPQQDRAKETASLTTDLAA